VHAVHDLIPAAFNSRIPLSTANRTQPAKLHISFEENARVHWRG